MHQISIHISGTYSKQGSVTHNHYLFSASHSDVCEYVLLNLKSNNVTSVTQ